MDRPLPPPAGITLTEQAFARLRHAILSGEFQGDAKLKVDELQVAYGFSNSPLREALSRLSQEGLIRADARRGFRVAPMSLEDLGDITHLRRMLDVPALRESVTHGDESWEAALMVAFHRLERAEARLGDGPVALDDGWSDLHRGFHLALLAACPSERQKAWSTSLFDQAERYRRYSARFRKASRRKSNEHRKLLDAALNRDADLACALLSEHITSTQRNVQVAFKEGPRSWKDRSAAS